MDHITYHDREFALVVGSANLDVLASTCEPFENIRKKGKIDLSFGGAAHNIAVNLAQMGMPAKFMGAMNNGAVAKMIREDFRLNEVATHILVDEKLDDAVFVGQFKDGDLTSSISSTAVADVKFTKKYMKDALRGSSCAIINCVFGVDVVNDLIKEANKAKVPVFIGVNSEDRALKVPQLKGKIDICFLNHHEMTYMVKQTEGLQNWEDAARLLGCTFVVTEGEHGMHVVSPQGRKHIPVTPIEVTGNTLGAGDFIISATIYYYVSRKMPLEEALHRAQLKVEKILTQDHVHLGGGDALKLSLQAVTNRAENDPLTGLYNRYGLANFYAADGLARQRFCALILDIDHFKLVNDAYGHDVGDKVLQYVGKMLAGNIRRGDAACRWGGEEFVVLLVNISKKQAEKIANDLREEIAAHPQAVIEGKHITMSIGVADSHEGEPLEVLVKRADEALYDAKKTGRNKVCVAA